MVPGQPFELRDGHGDPPLAPIGVVQAAAIGHRLSGEAIDALYVTTLRRTQETAAPLAAVLQIEPRVCAELREVHLGEWEGGLLRERAAEGDPLVAEMLRTQRWDVIPGAEPEDDFRERVRGALLAIHEAHRDQRVVAVVHGGVIGMALAETVGTRGFAFSGSDNASISRIVVDGERWHLRGFNDVSHLTDIDDDA